MKIPVLFTSTCLVLFSSGSAAPQDESHLQSLMLREGVSLHDVTDRDMHVWWDDFKKSMETLKNEKEGLVCTNPDRLLEQLGILKATLTRIRVQWELKKKQLKELKDALENKDYKNTGLSKDAGECKDVEDYIKNHNKTAEEEDITLKDELKQIIDLFTWIDEFPCDCVWEQWQGWTGCSKTCGGGIQRREKFFTKPAKNGGEECLGPNFEELPCNEKGCPFDCVWEAWTEWTPCPEDCKVGGNFQLRSREFEEHRNGGLPCEGPTSEKKPCFIVPIMKTKIATQQEEIDDLKKSLEECKGGKYDLGLTIEDLEAKLCDLLSCKNGGICQKGSCQCLEGFTGLTCEEKLNPATTVTCSFIVTNSFTQSMSSNRIHGAYYNGKPLMVTGNMKGYMIENTITFNANGCGTLKIVGEDINNLNHCELGGLTLHCTATDVTSPWNNFKTDQTNWMAEDGSELCSVHDKGMISSTTKPQFLEDLLKHGAKKIWTDKKKVTLIGTPSGCPPLAPPATKPPAPPVTAKPEEATLKPEVTTMKPVGPTGDGTCAAGYRLNFGDIFGFGQMTFVPPAPLVNALDIFHILPAYDGPKSNQECARKCNEFKDGSCCSYEWYPTEERCNLNQQCNPVANSVADGQFCERMSSTECATGFDLIPGDVRGWGSTLGSLKNVDTTNDCAAQCNAKPNCCSYEWSSLSKICNLNQECSPNAVQFNEYRFCVRKQKDEIPAGTLPNAGKFVIRNKGTGKMIRYDGSHIPKLADTCDHTNEFILYKGALKPAYRDLIMEVDSLIPLRRRSIDQPTDRFLDLLNPLNVVGNVVKHVENIAKPVVKHVENMVVKPVVDTGKAVIDSAVEHVVKPVVDTGDAIIDAILPPPKVVLVHVPLVPVAHQKLKMEGNCLVSENNIFGAKFIVVGDGDQIKAERSDNVKCDKPEQQWEILASCP